MTQSHVGLTDEPAQGNYAINLAKPSLAWQFSSAAVNLCQILGYHREYHVKPEKPGQRNTRALLFWHVYLLDKSLSLRLGISSGLRNPDITVSRSIDSSVVEDPWGPIISNWIEECDIANRIYEELLVLHLSRVAQRRSDSIIGTAPPPWRNRPSNG